MSFSTKLHEKDSLNYSKKGLDKDKQYSIIPRWDLMKRRRKILLAIGTVLVASSATLSAIIYTKAKHEVAVLVVAKTIDKYQRIHASNIRIARIGLGSGVSPIYARYESEVLDMHAQVTLLPGELLTANALAKEEPIPTGDAIVGANLSPSQLPAGGVISGAQVMMILTLPPGESGTSVQGASVPTPATGSQPQESINNRRVIDTNQSIPLGEVLSLQPGTIIGIARVYSVQVNNQPISGNMLSSTPNISTGEQVSLIVSQALAPSVAVAATADQIALAIIPDTSYSISSKYPGNLRHNTVITKLKN